MRTVLLFLVACLPYEPIEAAACGTDNADASCSSITTCCTDDSCWFEAGGRDYRCASTEDCDAAADLVLADNCLS